MRASKEGKFLTSLKREPAFISKGFTYWKEATTAFRKHQASDCHREANEAVIILPKQTGNIGEMLSSEHQAEKASNRKVFLTLLQNIRYLARQGLALRGGDEDADGNYNQLIFLRRNDIPEINEWIKKKTNKYTSHDIQNECIKLMALSLVRQLSQNVRSSKCYTIMADECTDKANHEQFTICIRWVGEDLQDHEDFVGLYYVGTIDATCLEHAITDTLLRMGVSLSQCRGQCYDGASNMSGSRSGVAAKLLAKEKRALYIHCFAHALNLAVGTTMKQSKVCSEALEVSFEVSKLIKFSPKRNAALDNIKAEDPEDDSISDTGIRTFCPTRWTVRGESIASILENYIVLKKLWDECLSSAKYLTPDVKGRLIGVKFQMSQYRLLFGMHLCERILKITDNLSKTLQNKSLSAAEGNAVARLTISTLKGMRNDKMFKLFLANVECMRQRTETNEPSLPRKRMAPRHLEVGEGESYHPATIEDHYRPIYFEALDLAIGSIEDRFDQPGYRIYQNLEQLLILAANKGDFSALLKEVTSFYDEIDRNELATQLEILGNSFIGTQAVTLKEILTFVRNLSEGQRVFFSQVCLIISFIVVMPATNATSERSFSTMKRIKTYLRSTMGQARLNHLMTLNIYKSKLDELNLHAIANDFVYGNEHRLKIFGNF